MLAVQKILTILQDIKPVTWATKHYPSRGQTSVQELYHTNHGKFFLKRTSERNLQDCQIDATTGSLAEREYWAFCLARHIGIKTPDLWLIDKMTTVQRWEDIVDARQYTTLQGPLQLHAQDVFECTLFDWISAQQDRHDANYLYDFVNEKIILIDSAHSFLKYSGSIPDYLKYFERGLSETELKKKRKSTILENIRSLENVLTQIVPLRNNDEIESLKRRVSEIQNKNSIQDLINLYRTGKE